MKTCESCFSDIDERAKRCPRCQTWQSKSQTIFHNPAFPLILFFLFIFSISGYFQLRASETLSFSDYADKIHIKESRMEIGGNSYGETIAIIGKLENESAIDWRDITYEVTFFDSDNTLSDTYQKNYFSFVLPAKGVVPFKVSMEKEFDMGKYQNYTIRVLSARTKLRFFE